MIKLLKFRVCGFLHAKLEKQNKKIFCLKYHKNGDYLADQDTVWKVIMK
jgi:hypothetical protein